MRFFKSSNNILLFLLMISFSSGLFAIDINTLVLVDDKQSLVDSGKAKVINFVDNAKGIVVINDREYFLKLNSKISNENNRKLNRYALKPGQFVKFKPSFEDKKSFINSLVILKK